LYPPLRLPERHRRLAGIGILTLVAAESANPLCAQTPQAAEERMSPQYLVHFILYRLNGASPMAIAFTASATEFRI